jgi:hypothetical protein
MLKQKFRRGNLVHIIKGACQPHFTQGCNAIILGSYDDFYGGGDIFQYSVIFPENGQCCSWYDADQLTLVEEGGEYLIEHVKENRIKTEAKYILLNEDIDHLAENEIVTLLRFIGFDYSIGNNYFAFWERVKTTFKEIKTSDSPNILRERYPDYDIDSVWNIFHSEN